MPRHRCRAPLASIAPPRPNLRPGPFLQALRRNQRLISQVHIFPINLSATKRYETIINFPFFPTTTYTFANYTEFASPPCTNHFIHFIIPYLPFTKRLSSRSLADDLTGRRRLVHQRTSMNREAQRWRLNPNSQCQKPPSQKRHLHAVLQPTLTGVLFFARLKNYVQIFK